MLSLNIPFSGVLCAPFSQLGFRKGFLALNGRIEKEEYQPLASKHHSIDQNRKNKVLNPTERRNGNQIVLWEDGRPRKPGSPTGTAW